MKKVLVLMFLWFCHGHLTAQKDSPAGTGKSRLIYKDDFKNLDNWIAEVAGTNASKIFTKNNQVIIDVDGGATLWFKHKLRGNIIISYKRTVLVDTGKNDRLSDLNQFWMATDPHNPHLFTRDGTFAAYDSLLMYYAGMGGNHNTTTRFRKYQGNGEKTLLREYLDTAHLLQPNREYEVVTVVNKGYTRVMVNGQAYFEFADPQPLASGYFGIRTTESRQQVREFRVYQVED